MDEANRIFDYLPVSFGNKSELDYIISLQEAMHSNYENKHYQFSYLAFHMLFMAAVYYNVVQIREHSHSDYKKIIFGFSELLELEEGFRDNTKDDAKKEFSPFALSAENERRIFELFRFLGFEKQHIGKFKKIVDFRNELAHCNGKASLNSEDTIIKNVNIALRLVEELQQATKKHIDEIYKEFLATPEEEWEYDTVKEQVEEYFIKRFYLSLADLKFCTQFNTADLGEAAQASAQKLHQFILQNFQDELLDQD
jgi:hypothetical protein